MLFFRHSSRKKKRDPTNPNKLFAAMWEHRRWPWFFKSGGPGSGVDAPSPALKPETSHNLEIGAKIQQNNFKASMFLFYNQLKNIIDRFRGSYNGLNFFDENQNDLRDTDEVDIYQKRNTASLSLLVVNFQLIGDYLTCGLCPDLFFGLTDKIVHLKNL